MTASEGIRTTSPIEIWVVAAALAMGTWIRFDHVSQVGLSHFDEGIYAISGLACWTGQFEAFQGYYSPPFYPLLVAGANFLFARPDISAGTTPVVVSAISGSLAILLAWRAGRFWWNAQVGMTGAWLIALDGVLISFSRAGLTDATFVLLLLLAVQLGRRAIETGGWGKIVLAGVAIGFTWNTKYNGWISVLLLVSSCLPSRLQISRLLSIALISFVVYLPWLTWFHVKHGYASLVEHQRGYLAGLAAVPQNLATAFAEANLLEVPWFAASAVFAATLTHLFAFRRNTSAARALTVCAAGAIAGIAAFAAPIATWFGLAVAGFCIESRNRLASCWTLAILLLLPAIYTPYLRLWLPFQMFLLLHASAGLSAILCRCLSRGDATPVSNSIAEQPGRGTVAIPFAAAAAIGIAVGTWGPVAIGPPSPAGYRVPATLLSQWCEAQGKVVACFARPPMTFYLAMSNTPFRRLFPDRFDVSDLEPNEVLVVDRMLHDSPGFRSALERQRDRLHLVQSLNMQPNLVTVLDDFGPAELPVPPDAYEIQVYERNRDR